MLIVVYHGWWQLGSDFRAKALGYQGAVLLVAAAAVLEVGSTDPTVMAIVDHAER